MDKIRIGKRLDDGSDVTLEIQSLIYSRALIQGNSGAGKSGLMRVIAEQVAAKIPTIIIDKEGEYHTLREKLDLVLVGEQGEIGANVRSAGLLARKLVELGASAVCNLYELKLSQQREWVKNFIESLMSLPKTLWHPTFVMIDECDVFAPEKGFGESTATEAVIDLMARGRKHGLCGIPATQRLSKLHKNVAAEVNNVFIGRTWLDTDQSRAGKMLGLSSAAALLLRDFEKREFQAFGPALNVNGVVHFRVADCETTIPKPGERKALTPPKASSVVVEIAEKLKDLPQQAEAEIKTFNDAKKRVGELEREVRTLKRNAPVVEKPIETIKTVEKSVLKDTQIKRLEKFGGSLESVAAKFTDSVAALSTVAREIQASLAKVSTNGHKLAAPSPRAIQTAGYVPAKPARQIRREVDRTVEGDGPSITGGALRILKVLASKPEMQLTKPQLGTLSRMKHTGGSFGTYMSRLRTSGFIVEQGQYVSITDEGIDFIGADRLPEPQTSEEVLQRWLNTPAISGGAANMLTTLFNLRREGKGLTRSELGEAVNMEPSGGSFGTYLSRLRSNGLIQEEGGVIYASDTLFINE